MPFYLFDPLKDKIMLLKTSFEPAPLPGSISTTADIFKGHHIIQAALCGTIYHKLHLKDEDTRHSLSGSYALRNENPDDGKAHLDALMSLPGKFSVASTEDENGKPLPPELDENGHPFILYGFSNADGISLNPALIKECLWFGCMSPGRLDGAV